MESKKRRHLKPVESRDPADDPDVIAALREIVRAIMKHPREEWRSRLIDAARDMCADLRALDADIAARDASPIYRKTRKNKIRSERAGKVRRNGK